MKIKETSPPRVSKEGIQSLQGRRGSQMALECVVLLHHPAGSKVRLREEQPAQGYIQGQRPTEIRKLLAPGDSRLAFFVLFFQLLVLTFSTSKQYSFCTSAKDACFFVIVFESGSRVA